MSVLFVTEESFQLDSGELNWVKHTVHKQNRLILAIMLKFFQIQYSFPESLEQISSTLITCLADKFNLDANCIKEFDWNSQMAWRYRRIIRTYLGFRKNTTADMIAFAAWLMEIAIDGAPIIKRTIHSAIHVE